MITTQQQPSQSVFVFLSQGAVLAICRGRQCLVSGVLLVYQHAVLIAVRAFCCRWGASNLLLLRSLLRFLTASRCSPATQQNHAVCLFVFSSQGVVLAICRGRPCLVSGVLLWRTSSVMMSAPLRFLTASRCVSVTQQPHQKARRCFVLFLGSCCAHSGWWSCCRWQTTSVAGGVTYRPDTGPRCLLVT